MNRENSPAKEALNQPDAERTQVGRGFWTLSAVALAVVGALSYRVAAEAPQAEFTLPPVAIVILCILAGGVYGFALRRQAPPIHWWLLASSLAGFLAAGVSVFTTFLARSSAGLFAGWAYAWAAYGALLGIALRRISPDHRVMLACIGGWALAGLVSGALGWGTDVCVVRDAGSTWDPVPSTSRTWSMAGIALIGAVCGAIGGASTGAALVRMLRQQAPPRDHAAQKPKVTRHVTVAGVISGLIAAVLCAYVAPLVVTVLIEGSLDTVDMMSYVIAVLGGSVLCLPTLGIVSIPLGIGCGHVGLEMGRARGSPDVRPWIWGGAAVGGVAGVVAGSLLVLAVGLL